MSRDTFRRLSALPGHFATGMPTKMLVTVLGIVLVGSMLAACGAAATVVKATPSPTPTHVIAPTPTPAFTPTPKPSPTPVPMPKPTPTQVPSVPPTPVPAAPAILDLRPLSMSIVGHLDCQKNGAYSCLARVLSRASNQSNLNWTAFSNVPGGITFSPASGILAPGQSVLVTITVPFTSCTPGLFFFRGPVNTHTITWAC
jgi:hypothetical protein